MTRIILGIIMLLSVTTCRNNERVAFTVLFNTDVIDAPVAVNLNNLFDEAPENIQLFEMTGNGKKEVPVQIDPSNPEPLAWFIAGGKTSAGVKRTFEALVSAGNRSAGQQKVSIDKNKESLAVLEDKKERLSYAIKDVMPPEGVEDIYKRSAHIHPLYAPSSEVLTNIQPKDHYHHYGIWNPWTKTHIGEQEIDYWNLGKGQGTVKTRAVLAATGGDLFAHFTALQQHIAFNLYGQDSVNTMDEFWDVRTWKAQGNRYQLDLFTTFRNILEDTILFDAYRYGGGLGYRATPRWNSETSTVLTSEGKTRADADATRAKWCIIEGESDASEGRSGILFMSHPDNREHPEPMRVWPPGGNNDELFFEFCPIRHSEWKILPGRDNSLKYRMVVFDGKMSAKEAEMYWNAFAMKPIIERQQP